MADSLRTLSLFAGVGGLDLGFYAACRDVGLSARAVGYVEREAFGAACLVAAMERGDLAPAPVFVGDVGRCVYPAADVVLAGFPCPPVSCAGKRRGTEDERWLWPEVVRAVRDSGARFVALENVRGLLSANDGAAFGAVLGDLADLGFDAEWIVLGARDVGAPHRRDRVFVLADRAGKRGEGQRVPPADERRAFGDEPHGRRGDVGDAEREPVGTEREQDARGGTGRGSDHRPVPRDASGFPLRWPPGPGDRAAWQRIIDADPGLAPATQRGLRRVADELPAGVDGPGEVDPKDAWSVLRAAARIAREGGLPDDKIERCDETGGRWHVAGLCSDASGLARWVRTALADPELWGLGERTVEALVQRSARWRGLSTPGDRRRSASVSGPVAGAESGRDVRTDRLRALGNAVVPAQARAAFGELWRRLGW